jgi:hypothetical protein
MLSESGFDLQLAWIAAVVLDEELMNFFSAFST